MTSIASDSPIVDPSDDRFNRRLFAERIANTIIHRKNKSSIVIGIYGFWGYGKTTVMNFVEFELKENQNINILKFNPWRFTNEEEMLLGFYHSIAILLGKSEDTNWEKFGKWIGKNLRWIASIFKQGEALTEFSKLLTTGGIEEKKKRINTLIEKTGKKIVILIDDIDRLDKDEVQALFRLVKLNADFNNTTYILAFDDEMVAAALQEKYGSNDRESGRSFLEKIIQVPLQLPAIPITTLRQFCLKKIDDVLNEMSVNLTEDEERRFGRNYINSIENRIVNPRLAIRYGNIINLTLPILEGEVNTVDLMLIEGIRLFYPRLYEAIKKHPESFLVTGGLLDIESLRENEKKRIRDLIDCSLEDYSQEDKEAAVELLKSLFPRLEGIYGNTLYGHDWEATWAKEKRIASKDYIYRYMSYSITETDISDNTLEIFITSLEEHSISEGSKAFIALISKSNIEMVISKLRRKSKTISLESSIKLIKIIAMNGKYYPETENLFSFTGTFSQAAMLISNLLENIPNHETQFILVKEITIIAEPIAFSLEITRWLKYENSEREHWIFTKEEGRIIKQSLADRIRNICLGNNIFEIFPKHSNSLLSSWAKWGSFKDQDTYIEGIFNSDPKLVTTFLNNFVPIAHEVGTGKQSKADFDQDCYNNLEQIISPDFVFNTLLKVYGDKLILEFYPMDFQVQDVDLRIAEQFAWLHIKNKQKDKKQNDEEVTN